ncbi:MAG: polysaccharide biosynthesis transport protein [Blastocatellia bacterium]|jgi:capsular exopolysaccharide synthesis family protein|nr:polysaccharide biosynthesis transport protein [Blastocatellia bacterium]
MRELSYSDHGLSRTDLEGTRWLNGEHLASNDPMFSDTPSSPIWDYWLNLLKHRRLVMMFVVVSTLTCAIIVFLLMTPVYLGETTLLIERNPPQILDQQALISPEPLVPDEHDFYKTQNEILTSRDLASQVIREENLEHNSLIAGDGHGPISWLKAKVKGLASLLFRNEKPIQKPGSVDSDLIDHYLKDILEVKPVLQTRMVKIEIRTPDPVLSAKLADAHAQAFIRGGVRRRTKPGEEAQKFLDEKLVELKERLAHSEAALSDFRRKRGIVDNLDSVGNERGTNVEKRAGIVIDRLSDLNRLATEAEADRIGLEAQVRLIQKSDYDALPAVVNSTLIQTLKGQVATLEASYAALSNRYMPAYPALAQAQAQLDQAKERLAHEIREVVASIQSSFMAAQKKEDGLQDKLELQKAAALSLRDAAVEYALLAREADTNRQLYDSVVQRMKEMGMAAQLRASNVSIIDPAVPPLRPASPKKLISLLLSALVGLLAGVTTALLIESMDNTLNTVEDTEKYLRLPNLAIVPDFASLDRMMGSRMGKRPAQLAAGTLPSLSQQMTLEHRSPPHLVEAYRALQTALLLSRAKSPPKTIVFSSASASEGKTTTTLNSAICFARNGAKVLIIDAELRRSACHKILQISNGAGLTDILTGQKQTAEVIRTVIPGSLYFISSGTKSPNPGALLSSQVMRDLLNTLKSQYDFILIDACPTLPVSDAVLLSNAVDAVVFVVNSSKTQRQLARQAIIRLHRAQAPLVGTILNQVNLQHGRDAYYYRDNISYYEPDPLDSSFDEAV